VPSRFSNLEKDQGGGKGLRRGWFKGERGKEEDIQKETSSALQGMSLAKKVATVLGREKQKKRWF